MLLVCCTMLTVIYPYVSPLIVYSHFSLNLNLVVLLSGTLKCTLIFLAVVITNCIRNHQSLDAVFECYMLVV